MLLEQDDYWGGYAVCHDNHTIYLKISKEKKKKKSCLQTAPNIIVFPLFSLKTKISEGQNLHTA